MKERDRQGEMRYKDKERNIRRVQAKTEREHCISTVYIQTSHKMYLRVMYAGLLKSYLRIGK